MQRGEVFKRHGSWHCRYYEAPGQRRTLGGFRTKGEARGKLEEALRQLRTGRQPDITLAELVDSFLAQHEAAPATIERLRWQLGKAVTEWGEKRLRAITAAEIAAWRPTIAEGHRHQTIGSLRQVLAYALRLKMLEENPALAVKNPAPKPREIKPFDSWQEIEALALELGPWGPIAVLAAGTGLRPEEWIALEWRDIDIEGHSLTVQRAYAKGDLTQWGKTVKSRRRVPLRSRVVDVLASLPRSRGLVFPAQRGGHISLHNWRAREWKPALRAAGLPLHRIYDLRHTYATWSLAAGVGLFALARRMGTSVEMIDRTYGHLAPDADAYEVELLDAWDGRNGHGGRVMGAQAREEN